MNWSVFGRLLVPALVHAQQFVEAKKVVGKKQAALDLVKQELSDLDDVGLLSNPKVVVAVDKLNDALVDAQNVIAAVKAEATDKP